MGWFLSNNKKKIKKKTKRGRSADPAWDPKRTLLGMKFAGAAGAVFAVVLVWHFGAERLQAYIAENHGQEVSPDAIRFSDKPVFLSPTKDNDLRSKLASAVGSNPLNREGLEKAAEILRQRKDIVKELRQVRRLPDGTIDIDVTFRTPAALLLMRNAVTGEISKDGYHVIDDEGYHIESVQRKPHVAQFNLPTIVGVNSADRPPDYKGVYHWDSQEVQSALKLIALMKGTPAMDCIDSISVNVVDDRDRIRLVINTVVMPSANSRAVDCRIVWGLPPGQEQSIEPDADRKLAALNTLLANGKYRNGMWQEVWINKGSIQPAQAIVGSRQ